jgi:leucyl/phenylalanyl-tRNA---protein transferase
MPASFPSRFPSPQSADRYGVVAWDGPLATARLVDAYCHGIFPWPMRVEGAWHTAWCSPNPRAVLPTDRFHLPSRLARKIRAGKFLFTVNEAFEAVVEQCASVGDRLENAWISPPLKRAYMRMFAAGMAFSIEVWEPGDRASPETHDPGVADHSHRSAAPIGGLCGIRIAGLIAAESMFHHVSDASKAAIFHLVQWARQTAATLIDIQQLTPHMAALGAVEIPRTDYLRQLSQAVQGFTPQAT